jgi:hypothetical protein
MLGGGGGFSGDDLFHVKHLKSKDKDKNKHQSQSL